MRTGRANEAIAAAGATGARRGGSSFTKNEPLRAPPWAGLVAAALLYVAGGWFAATRAPSRGVPEFTSAELFWPTPMLAFGMGEPWTPAMRPWSFERRRGRDA